MSAQAAPRDLIAVIDEDDAVRGALSFALETEGFDVRVYESAEAALADGLDAFGCVVLDERLPRMRGLELIAELKARGAFIPAILVATNPNASVRSRARAAGVDLVEKPLMGGVLIEHVRSALK